MNCWPETASLPSLRVAPKLISKSAFRQRLSFMARSDRRALVAAICLGFISAALGAAAVYAAGIVFFIFSMINPLVVSLLARHRIMSFSQVPNLIMAATLTILLLIYGASTVNRYGPEERMLGALCVLAAAVIPALLVSGIVKLVRHKTASGARKQ